MLNPYLKLNTKLFDKDVEMAPTRQGYGQGLLELGDKNPAVVALSADLTESTHAHLFAEKYPQRFFEVGISEQNMVAIAAGLAVSGKIPFTSSYAAFSPGKNWETIRTTIAYNNANVKIAGHHAGIMTGPDGATHQAIEDLALSRVLANFEVYNPCDAIEAKKTTIAAGEHNGPVYIRYTRDKTPVMTTDHTPFAKGKVQTFWTAEKPEVTIFGTGYLLYQALLAARELEREGIPVLVVNVATIKLLDIKGILESVRESKAAVSIEDHQIAGGLGGALAELFAKERPTPMEFVGMQDTFGESGTPDELIKKYHMDKNSVIEAVKKIIRRK